MLQTAVIRYKFSNMSREVEALQAWLEVRSSFIKTSLHMTESRLPEALDTFEIPFPHILDLANGILFRA